MKKIITTLLLMIATSNTFAQTALKEYKIGHVVTLNLPDYMSRTLDLNSDAIIQYKSIVKDVYGFVIEDNKEELALAEMNFSSINEFCEEFAKGFLKDEKKKIFSYPEYKKIGDTNFAEFDATYYDKDAKAEIYYLVGIVETKTAFYKVLSFSSKENKDKFKADFQSILYSIKD